MNGRIVQVRVPVSGHRSRGASRRGQAAPTTVYCPALARSQYHCANTSTNVNRYAASGNVHSNGVGATSISFTLTGTNDGFEGIASDGEYAATTCY